MKPFFQGKLDVFCAMYAVLNGLRLTHHIRTLEAREIFHQTLIGLAPNAQAFSAILMQTTDYIALVDGMLRIQEQERALISHRPFVSAGRTVSAVDVWDCCKSWLGGDSHRAVVFRFARHLRHDAPAVNYHWTTAKHIADDRMELFDCSHESTAIYHIGRHAFVTLPASIDEQHLLCIEPHSIRLLGQRAPCAATL